MRKPKTKHKPETEGQNPVGRPSKYDPKFCDLILEMRAQGKSIVQFCAAAGICRDTYQEWKLSYPDFSVASKKAQHLAEAWWENLAQENLIFRQGSGEKLDTVLWYMNMKNRFGWTDRTETKTENKTSLTLSYPDPEDEDQE